MKTNDDNYKLAHPYFIHTRKIAKDYSLALPENSEHSLENDAVLLDFLCKKSLENRFRHIDSSLFQEYEVRLQKEIDIYNKRQLTSYILIIWDIVKETKSRDIPICQGKGFLSSSLVSFLLDMTNINPIEHNLIFEVFLSTKKLYIEEIGIDICPKRLKEVIDYIYNSYDNRKIIKTKSSLLDYVPIVYISNDLLNSENENKEIKNIYDDKFLENSNLVSIGFYPFDFLTKKYEILNLIKENYGKEIALDEINFNDSKVFEAFLSDNMSDLLFFQDTQFLEAVRKVKPISLIDLASIFVLHRYVPTTLGVLQKFIDNKNNKNSIKYKLPIHKQILEDTYGIIVYREQVSQIIKHITGFGVLKINRALRVLGIKKPDELIWLKNVLISGAKRHGYDEEVINEIFDELLYMRVMTLRKAHSIAYASMVYQEVWLKTYYPKEFAICS